MKKSRSKGFTLIELLTVIAIMGLLMTIAVAGLNSSKRKTRDGKRVADMRQVHTALEVYFAGNGSYPAAPTALGGCAAGVLGCQGGNGMKLCNGGFQPSSFACTATYMDPMPTAPIPREPGCTAAENRYTYTAGAGTPPGSYSLAFCTGSPVGDVLAGTHILDNSGIQ